MLNVPTTPSPKDTRLMRWRKILTVYQNQAGSLAHNNLFLGSTLRQVKVKVLRAIQKV